MIFETNNFEVVAPQKPHVSREDGGHMKIVPKNPIEDRSDLTPELATECAYIISLVGQAYKNVMPSRGVDVVRMNYQDNGNWCYFYNKSPYFHVHLYGRTFTSKYQPLPSSLNFPLPNTGFYDNFKPLTLEDEKAIAGEIEVLLKTEKFDKSKWKLI